MENLIRIQENSTILRWNRDEDVISLPKPHLESSLLNEITNRIIESKDLKFGISNSGIRQYQDVLFYQCLPTIGRYTISPSCHWNHNDLLESKMAQSRFPTRNAIAYRIYIDGKEAALIFTPSMKKANVIIFETYKDFYQMISTHPESIHRGGWTKEANEIMRRINSYII